jgi:hypothetical protein
VRLARRSLDQTVWQINAAKATGEQDQKRWSLLRREADALLKPAKP